MKIFKFALAITDHQTLAIKGFQKVLSIAVQNDSLVLYAIVNPDDESVTTIPVLIHGTGHSFSLTAVDCWQFMGTYMTCGDSLVWHVWVPLAAIHKDEKAEASND